ncbi:YggS family pyridoxal phosphate-dependent enzyme [Candidatus Woesearchaeota archaeon]|nr:YggS family pyridoxal phosphate-dependent enzyme [Candidatus Woesearchaeota archaeon]
MSIKKNIRDIRQELPKNITLIAASKTRSVDEIKQAAEAGIRIIGENYVQEAEKKYSELKGKVKFHLIGHLQKNKAKKAVEIFDMIQTVDSLDIAKEINKRCQDIKKIMPVLIEVNSGKEPNKNGVMPEHAENLIREISSLKNINVKGLMTMAPYFDDPEKDRPYFRLTKTLFEKIKALNIPNTDIKILSMGMSHSYKTAIEEGANMVRIGTRIFGSRQ